MTVTTVTTVTTPSGLNRRDVTVGVTVCRTRDGWRDGMRDGWRPPKRLKIKVVWRLWRL